MTRRALLSGLALVAVLFAASGAWADTQVKVSSSTGRDGFVGKRLTFTPGNVDTSLTRFIVADLVNDSLIFHSEPFTVLTPWTVAWGRLFYRTQDTVSTVDSIGYELQVKFASEYDSTWHPFATCVKADEDLINTTPISADIKAFADADSVVFGDYFRVKFALIAEEQQWRAEDVAGVIPFNAVYILELRFIHKGNQ